MRVKWSNYVLWGSPLCALVAFIFAVLGMMSGYDLETMQPDKYLLRINTTNIGQNIFTDELKKLFPQIKKRSLILEERDPFSNEERGFSLGPVTIPTSTDEIKDTVNDGVNTVTNGVTSLASNAVEFGKDIVDKVKDFANMILDEARKLLEKLIKEIMKAFKDMLELEDFITVNSLTLCRGKYEKEGTVATVTKCTDPSKLVSGVNFLGDLIKPLAGIKDIPLIGGAVKPLTEKMEETNTKINAVFQAVAGIFIFRLIIIIFAFGGSIATATLVQIKEDDEELKKKAFMFGTIGVGSVAVALLLFNIGVTAAGAKAVAEINKIGSVLDIKSEVGSVYMAMMWVCWLFMTLAAGLIAGAWFSDKRWNTEKHDPDADGGVKNGGLDVDRFGPPPTRQDSDLTVRGDMDNDYPDPEKFNNNNYPDERFNNNSNRF